MKGRPKGSANKDKKEPMEVVYVRLPLAEVSQRKKEARDIGISLSAYLRLFIDGPAKTIK